MVEGSNILLCRAPSSWYCRELQGKQIMRKALYSRISREQQKLLEVGRMRRHWAVLLLELDPAVAEPLAEPLAEAYPLGSVIV